MPSNNSEIILRPAAERGVTKTKWLDSHHSFSFGEYYDPKHMGFRTLRVINEDRIKPVMGFGTHPHQNMEIVTYVMEGNLKHEDSMGNGSVIKAGDVQKMSAGTGIFHSEYNASPQEDVHLLQIWILPKETGLKPSYQQFLLPKPGEQKGPLHLFASPDGGKEVIKMHQDIKIYRVVIKRGEKISYLLAARHGAWVQMIMGKLELNNQLLKTGDGASIENQSEINFATQENSEFLLFDLK